VGLWSTRESHNANRISRTLFALTQDVLASCTLFWQCADETKNLYNDPRKYNCVMCRAIEQSFLNDDQGESFSTESASVSHVFIAL
jgi:hypothetical protein